MAKGRPTKGIGTACKYNINNIITELCDILIGNSIANIAMLYICSYTFGF